MLRASHLERRQLSKNDSKIDPEVLTIWDGTIEAWLACCMVHTLWMTLRSYGESIGSQIATGTHLGEITKPAKSQTYDVCCYMEPYLETTRGVCKSAYLKMLHFQSALMCSWNTC